MINPPETCPLCAAERKGIQEGRAYYKCGSVLTDLGQKPRFKRTQDCVDADAKREAANYEA